MILEILGMNLNRSDANFIRFSTIPFVHRILETHFPCIVYTVGLSSILDSELIGGAPAERPHREVVGAAIVDDELFCKIIQRKNCDRSKSVSDLCDG